MRTSLKFRRASNRDLDRLVEIHLAAYPDSLSVAARERNFSSHPLGGPEHLVVAEDAGTIVGHAYLFPFCAHFGGAPVKVGGIASVGVAPEARGRGVATALMNHLHVLSDRRGDALTMLYAFRQGFYARLGYATTSSRKRLAIDARAVPASWRLLARERVRALRAGDDKTLRLLHSRAAARSSGWIARPKRFWEMLLARERRVTLVCEPPKKRRRKHELVATGYVAFSLCQLEAHGETRIEVDEIVAEDAESRRALFGALAAMRDQVTDILVEVAESDPIERALVDVDGHRFGTETVEHRLGEIVGGPMVRIEDIPRALSARGYASDGTFDVIVGSTGGDEGEVIALGVRVEGGRADVGPMRGSFEPESLRRALLTTRAGLAAIFYGALPATAAVALGLADADMRLASMIDAITRMPPLTPIDAF